MLLIVEQSSSDAPTARWEERARLSFALGQWRLTPNVFSRTGDALVLRTPVRRDNRLAETAAKAPAIQRRAQLPFRRQVSAPSQDLILQCAGPHQPDFAMSLALTIGQA